MQYAADPSELRSPLPAPDVIWDWAAAALEGHRDSAQMTVRVVGLGEARLLNETYRRQIGPTNVLTFPFDAGELLDPPLLGDIVICAPLLEQEAAEQGKALLAHWAHLVIHGVLHLLGYDHEVEAEAAVMEERERVLMGGLGLPDPYGDEGAAREQGPAAVAGGPP